MASFLYDMIKGRRSIRRYQDAPITPAVVNRLLEATMWAPSAHNRQPWRIAVVYQAATKEHLARTMGARLQADLMADQASEEVIAADVGRSYARITGAPLLMVACLTMADMDVYTDVKRATAEHLMAVQSVAMAVQNLLLAAHAEGLGACWMCAPLFCPDVVCEALQLPADWQPQALITLGYPSVTRQSTRHPQETRVLWR
jgi:coenzyme F420-0:L-glutamate ligase / coenzyme F420-1:gamma-L-glutamate ligase